MADCAKLGKRERKIPVHPGFATLKQQNEACGPPDGTRGDTPKNKKKKNSDMGEAEEEAFDVFNRDQQEWTEKKAKVAAEEEGAVGSRPDEASCARAAGGLVAKGLVGDEGCAPRAT